MKGRSSVTVTGSLRILTWFPLLTATRKQPALHMFNMELYWHYNNISVVYCQLCLILFSQFYEPDVTSPVIFREAFCHDIIYFFVCSCIFSVSVLYLFIFFTQAGTKRTSPFQTPWIPQSLRDLLRFARQMRSALADIFHLHLVASSRSVFV